MTLTSIDGTLLGPRTSISIMIPQNDDPNGVFSFVNTPVNLKRYAGMYTILQLTIIHSSLNCVVLFC